MLDNSVLSFQAVLRAAQWFIEVVQAPASPPVLAMVVVAAPTPQEPRLLAAHLPGRLDGPLGQYRHDLLRKERIDLELNYSWGPPTLRFFFYGDRGLLDRFLDLGRATVLELRPFDPAIDKSWAEVTADGEAYLIDLAWPTMMVETLWARRIDGVAHRARWPDGTGECVPYYEDELIEYQERRAAKGEPAVPVPPGDLNLTFLSHDCFTLSADLLGFIANIVYKGLGPAEREALESLAGAAPVPGRKQDRLRVYPDCDVPYAELDGEILVLENEVSAKYLARLVMADGERVGFKEFQRENHPKFDGAVGTRVLDGLPKEIGALIERKQGKSPRLRVELLQRDGAQ
jgi:hypothetical protein